MPKKGTKEKLYRQAKRLGVKGRSKMNKGQLKAALARRRKPARGDSRTKEKLYRQAKRQGIKGRSKMNKGQLNAALARRGH